MRPSVTKPNPRKIEKFLKEVLNPDHGKKKEASFDGLSMENFSPVPIATASWNLAQRDCAKKDNNKKKFSFDGISVDDLPLLPSAAAPWNHVQTERAKIKRFLLSKHQLSKIQAFNHMAAPNPRRNKKDTKGWEVQACGNQQ